jgi:hypothetical protein
MHLEGKELCGKNVYCFEKDNKIIMHHFNKKVAELQFNNSENVTHIKIYKQLAPDEGDFILQGRFGNTIKFGSFKGNGAIKSPAGSGITIIKQDIATTSKEADMMTTAEENAFDTEPASHTATIILTTKQQINNILACSDLTSLRVKFSDPEKRGKTQWEQEDSSKLRNG